MLRFMRKHASRWLLGVIFGIISVAFIFTFGFNNGGPGKTVAEVGPYKISAEEYYQAYKKLEDFYRNLYKDKFDDETKNQLNLKEATMNELVDKYLFLKEAEDMGVRVSDREFKDHLSGLEAFKANGVFNRSVYEEFLRRNNLDPKTFEDNERQAMVIEKMVRIISDNAPRADEKAAREAYLKERSQIKLSVAVFDPADYRDKADVDEKELAATYDREKGAYRSENTYHLRYILIDAKSGIKDDQAYMELLKSKDMPAYGKSKGIEVVDLGMMKESDLMARFTKLNPQQWLKGLGKGEISLPVREGDRSFIFQMVDREDGKPLEKSEALKAIRARLMDEKAKVIAMGKAEDAIKQKNAKFTKETGFIQRNSLTIQGIGQISSQDAGVLSLSKGGTYGKPVAIGGKYYVFACTDEKQPGNDQWEKDKDTYKRIYEAIATQAYLQSFKEALKKSVKVKVDWSEI